MIDESEFAERSAAIIRITAQSGIPNWRGVARQEIANLKLSMEKEAQEDLRRYRKRLAEEVFQDLKLSG